MTLSWNGSNFNLIRDSSGHYRLHPSPPNDDLVRYYAEKYYQDAKGSYSATYNELDKKYMEIGFKLRAHQAEQALGRKPATFLDVGCGEGWELANWASENAKVVGIDASEFGVEKHNPTFLENLLVGPIDQQLESLRMRGELFDLIYLGNVLEHLSDPSEALQQCIPLLGNEGIIQIRVPNDFSDLQLALADSGRAKDRYWIAVPDHLSYFNRESLLTYCESHGLSQLASFASFPIDWFIVNSHSNYVTDSEKGKEAYRSSVFLEDLIVSSNTLENVYRFLTALSDIGHGRDITSVFKASELK
jgi:2-polyprenyl-3-methyl-5-hydroxy-6-metoxy-1,4-benzoquinol methylase